MDTPNEMERVETLLNHWVERFFYPQPKRIDIEMDVGDLLPATTRLVDGHWGYLAAITGLDPGLAANSLWVLYHFVEGPTVATFRLSLPRENPMVPTIRHLIPLAGIYEQELSEVLGVTIAGVEGNGRLFLPDDWPDGVFPLRKDFQIA